jgi:thioredoxin 1
MSQSVKQISDQEFEQLVLQSEEPVLVDFWAPWCGPCKAIAPLVDDLAGKFDGRVSFTKINVDENPVTPSKYGVKAIPTIAIFKGGKPHEMIVGLTDRGKLEKAISGVIEGAESTQPFVQLTA